MKKFLALLLSAMMIFQVVYAEEVSSENTEEQEFLETVAKESIVNNSYYKILKALGVVSEAKDIDAEVTRGEFAYYLSNMGCAYTERMKEHKNSFVDIVGTEYEKEINALYGIGAMNGYDAVTFSPEKNISYTEAVTAIMNFCGYREFANSKGGFPTGYMSAASSSSLLKGVVGGDSITFENLCRLLYNALHISLVDTTLSLQSNTYYINGDSNILKQYFNIEYLYGQIIATEYTSVGGAANVSKDQIMADIGDTDYRYDCKDIDLDDMLGYFGYFYVTDENETVVAFEPKENKVEDVTIRRLDIVDINPELTALQYDNGNGRSRTYKISQVADFIYNGANYYGVTEADFDIDSGYVRLVDFEDDGVYDLVYIWKYDVFFVDTVTKEGYVSDIVTRNVMKLKDDSNYDDIRIYKYGKEVDVTYIQQMDVLSIATTKSNSVNKLRTVVISSDCIEGELKGIDEDIITIDETEYTMSGLFDRNYISHGIKALFGIDFMGEIACYKKQNSDEKRYGYLLGAGYDEFADDGENITLKIFNDAAVVERLNVAEKFYVNNSRSTWTELENFVKSGGEVTEQLIAYKLDKEGSIKRLYFSGAETPEPVNTANETLTLNKTYDGTKLMNHNINGTYIPNSLTKIFMVITDTNGKMMVEESSVETTSTLTRANNTRTKTSVYDVNSDMNVGALVFTIPITSYATMKGYAGLNAFVVNSVCEAWDEEESEVVYLVCGYLNGVDAEYYVDRDYDASAWRSGDVRLISLSNNRIIGANLLFAIENQSGTVSGSALYGDTDYSVYNAYWNYEDGFMTSERSNVYGVVKGLVSNNGWLCIRAAGTGDLRVAYLSADTKYYSYDGRHFSLKSKEDIRPGAKVFMYTRYGNAIDVVWIED